MRVIVPARHEVASGIVDDKRIEIGYGAAPQGQGELAMNHSPG
jgi:hypothetical protein